MLFDRGDESNADRVTCSGRIMNRLSKDISSIDQEAAESELLEGVFRLETC